MRAVILDVRDRTAAAMTDNGRFIRLTNAGYEVGQTVAVRAGTVRHRGRIAALASVAAAMMLILFGGFKAYTSPYGLVSLDVNPSIEYTINLFDRVLTVESVNGDGETVLSQIDEKALLHRPVDDAIAITIEQLRADGYLSEAEDNYVVLAANARSSAHAERLAASLRASLDTQSDLSVESVTASNESVNEAHRLGTSPGKLAAIERLQESLGNPDSFDPADWVDVPVRNILRECVKNSHDPSNSNAGGKNASPSETPDPAQGDSSSDGSQSSGNRSDAPGNGASNKKDSPAASPDASSHGSSKRKNSD